MPANGSGGRAARALFALLAFVLLGLAWHAVGAPSTGAALASAHGAPAAAGLGDTGGSPAVLPPPSRIHVVVNRGGEGAPSFGAAAATPAAVALAVRAFNATVDAPSRGDEPTAGTVHRRAPPR
jgi:hypothetical protein